MNDSFRTTVDAILDHAVSTEAGVPGVVAMVTDRDRTVYEGAAGVRRQGEDVPLRTDDVFALFSTTKAVTATAVLQLVERGQLDLDAPAAVHAPALAKLEVIEGFDEGGQPVLRAPRSPITTRQLLTHTAGFGYDFFDETYLRLATEHGQPSVTTCTMASLTTPLLFDPGTRWQYGSNVDWAGQVVEGVTGRRLGEVLRTEVFEPLGMSSMTFALDDARRSRLARIHARGTDGSLTALDLELPSPPEVDCGGHGLYGTVGDYLAFLRMWLADGRGPDGPVLRPETVQDAVANHLPTGFEVGAFRGVIPSLSNDAEFFPGVRKTWSLGFMRNEDPAPTGRPAGGQGWAGLANLFYWLDRENGVAGFWATQILPFGDATSFLDYLRFETAVYQALDR